MQVFNINQNHT